MILLVGLILRNLLLNTLTDILLFKFRPIHGNAVILEKAFPAHPVGRAGTAPITANQTDGNAQTLRKLLAEQIADAGPAGGILLTEFLPDHHLLGSVEILIQEALLLGIIKTHLRL